MTEEPNNKRSGWRAFGAFGKGRDAHGESGRSFLAYTVFFVGLAFLGIGFYTYLQVSGATIINKTSNISTNLEEGLVGHWTFDGEDMTTATATDRSGNAYNGALVGSPGRGIGKIGQGLTLDGVDDTVTTSDISFGGTNPISVCAWLYPRQLSGGSKVILGQATEIVLRTTSGGSGTVEFILNSFSTNDRVTSAVPIDLNEWSLVCGAYASGGALKIYINGEEEGSVTPTGTYGNSSSVFQLGYSGSAGAYWLGGMDDVRIYDRALSQADITSLYEQGDGSKISTTPPSTTVLDNGLVGHWTFDGGDMTTATATDVSGSGNDGTLTGGPTKVIGKVGQSLSFDGVNDHVVTSGASTDYQFPDSTFTVTGWFKKGDSSNGYIVTQGACSGGWGVYMLSGTLRVRLKSAGSCGGDAAYRNSNTTTLNDGDWHHFAAVVTTDNTTSTNNDVTVYIDGVANQGSVVRNGSPYSSTTAELMIGLSTGAGGYFSGLVDDIKVYNRELSADEVAQLYALGGVSTIKICREESVQDADANTYNTLAIGSQCWLDRNMNVGTRIAASTNQTNNGIIEKYCYSNSDTNCTTNNPNKPDGGLYQWNEAMQYSTTEGAQGICPSGFHIPTDTEWHTLEKFITDSGQSCSGTATGYRCSPAGTKLQSGGSSRFEGNLAGVSDYGSFSLRGTYGYWWSSSPSDGDAWYRFVVSGEDRVYRNANNQNIGLSVRCLQD